MTAASMNMTAGVTGASALNLNSTAGTGKVYLTCSNAPTNSTCSISPNYVDFTSSSTATATVESRPLRRTPAQSDAIAHEYGPSSLSVEHSLDSG